VGPPPPAAQSFQQINFFGPLSPQQQRQQQEFRSNNNPFFNSPSTARPSSAFQSFNNFNNPAQNQQPQNFGNRSPQDGGNSFPAPRPVAPRQQPEGTRQFQPSPQVGQAGTAQDPSQFQAMPVPLALRTTTERPAIQPSPPNRVASEDTLSVEAMLALSPEDSFFDRARPTNIPVRPIQQSLSDQSDESRDARLLRNRQRTRPAAQPVEVTAGEQVGRRVPVISQGNNPNLDPLITEDREVPAFVPGRLKNRFNPPPPAREVEDVVRDILVPTSTTTEASRNRPQQLFTRAKTTERTTTTTTRTTEDDEAEQTPRSPLIRPRLTTTQRVPLRTNIGPVRVLDTGEEEQSLVRPITIETTTKKEEIISNSVPQKPTLISVDRSTADPLNDDLSALVSEEADAVVEDELYDVLSSTEYYDDEEEIVGLSEEIPSSSEKSIKPIDQDNDHEPLSTEEEKHPPNNNRLTKLEILGRNNTSSVKLDNVVFVPNLDGLLLPQRPAPFSRGTTTVRTTTTTQQQLVQQPERQSKAIDTGSKTDQLLVKSPNKLPAKEGPVEPILESSPEDEAESTIDELDRFQSELSSKHLTNTFQVEAEKPISTTTVSTTSAKPAPPVFTAIPFRPPLRSFDRPRRPPFDPSQRATTTTSTTTPSWEDETSEGASVTSSPSSLEASTSTTVESPVVSESGVTSTTSPVATETTTELSLFEKLFGKTIVIKDDLSSLLPPGFKPPSEPESPDQVEISLLPPGFKVPTEPESPAPLDISLLPPDFKAPPEPEASPAPVDSSLLPPGFKTPTEPESPPTVDITALLPSGIKVEAEPVNPALLPPGFKAPTEPESPPAVDITALLPPGVKVEAEPVNPALLPPGFKVEVEPVNPALLPPGFKALPEPTSPKEGPQGPPISVDISSLLPPDFKPETEEPTTTVKKGLLDSLVFDDLSSALLPPNFKHHLFTPSPKRKNTEESPASVPEETTPSSVSEMTSPSGPEGPSEENISITTEGTTTSRKGLVFPTRAVPARNATTEKPRAKPTHSAVEIKSGWPIRYVTICTVLES